MRLYLNFFYILIISSCWYVCGMQEPQISDSKKTLRILIAEQKAADAARKARCASPSKHETHQTARRYQETTTEPTKSEEQKTIAQLIEENKKKSN